MKLVAENIIRFVLLVLMQVLIFDNIQFVGYVTPMPYILFVLVLPIHFSRNWTLILAFFLGLVIDMFNNTMGIHTFASVLVAFLRIPVIRGFFNIQDLVNVSPRPQTIGFLPNLKYLLILILIHQTTLFSLEAFGFYSIYMLMGKIILSTFITLLILLGIEYLDLSRSN